MPATCRIELLGGLRVLRGGEVVTHFDTRRAAVLLAFLALRPGRAQSREMLAELLWPDEDPAATRPRLRQTLSTVRHLLEPGGSPSPIEGDHSQVQLLPSAVRTDVAQFNGCLQAASSTAEHVERARSLSEAVALYRGELLPGFYDDWVLTERARLHEAYLQALLDLAAAKAGAGDAAGGLELAQHAVRTDPLREDAHRCLLRLYSAAGRVPDMLRHYRDLTRLLREEVGASPSAATQALYEELRQSATTGASEGAQARPPEARVSADPSPAGCKAPLEPVGGGVVLTSPFYITRPADAELCAAIRQRDSIVLVKGPRQVGKTSLLARGLHSARQSGIRVVLTDFQKLTAAQLGSTDQLFRTLAEMLAEQLELETPVESVWQEQRGWNVNFERFLRRVVLPASDAPLVWGLDEVDRLFGHPHASEVFGLFRAWHNERALDPEAPWSRLTLAIAYATEAHLFITDLNQSPFNVGTRLTLEDFHPDQVAELNRRHGSPVRTAGELGRLAALVGGHPYLVRCWLYELARGRRTSAEIEALAAREDGPFGDHLRRLRVGLAQDAELQDPVCQLLRGTKRMRPDHFYRLSAAGLLCGSADDPEFRCGVYREYLNRLFTIP